MRCEHSLHFAQVEHLGERLRQLHAALGTQIVVRNAAAARQCRTSDGNPRMRQVEKDWFPSCARR
eukprot:3490820-Prymnesium_polylepis.1